MVRVRWKEASIDDIMARVADVRASVTTIYGAIGAGNLVNYAAGAQQARTTLAYPANINNGAYPTNQQMHSEMVAVRWALMGNWALSGVAEIAVPGPAVTQAHFHTDLPHCGYCTVMLHALALPFTTPPPAGTGPTRGQYNQAVNLGYPLPDPLKHNLVFLARLYNGAGTTVAAINAGKVLVKQTINAFVNGRGADWALDLGGGVFVTDAGVVGAPAVANLATVAWNDIKDERRTVRNNTRFGTEPLIDLLWKVVFLALYEETH